MNNINLAQMDSQQNSLDVILIGMAGGFTAALMSGVGITLGLTALVSITSVIGKEIGLYLVRKYRAFKFKKKNND